ncbi:arylsulfatase [uncultured Draconibacterium sp.]|uniref:sulfatase family protein n=1 Tax=uncultured Draconibacterium sp. TaxID=1573823 RepID=UPI0025F41A3A|nr:arylsulfatase [uncultured Draconibacterium sp.]
MKRTGIIASLLVGIGLLVGCQSKTQKTDAQSDEKPNVVIIYMDDLGYGDMGAYGATELKTPNFDKLAEGGVRFTDGHATSATCTPSRYGLLTGVYPWRNDQAKILPGTAPLIIDTAQVTIPKIFKEKGYHTGIVGKWHLGLGSGVVDWNEHVKPGPNEVGFDDAYIMAATQDRVPTVYIDNGYVDGLDKNDPIEIDYQNNFEGQPTGKENPELCTYQMWHHGHNNTIINGIPRIGYMKGGEAARWKDVDMADHFLAKAQAYVKAHKNEPFFLVYTMQQPHVPRTPHPRFEGTSGMGPRGDVIVEADWCLGEFMKTLEEEGVLENTLIIFSSDNGPVLNDGYYDDAVEKLGDHKPAGALRGGKYSLFQAGTRVPFITYWKGKIQPKVSDALVCQVDILASLAELVGSDAQSMDSEPLLDVMMGNSDEGRQSLILEATSRTAMRSGNWALIPPYKGAKINTQVNIELGNEMEWQLYDLSSDISQQKNVADENPEILEELIAEFERIRGKEYSNVQNLKLK